MPTKLYQITLTEERLWAYIVALSVVGHVAEVRGNWPEADRWRTMASELRRAEPQVGSADK